METHELSSFAIFRTPHEWRAFRKARGFLCRYEYVGKKIEETWELHEDDEDSTVDGCVGN